MKTLTKAEEQVMQVVWKLKEGFIRDIMDALPPPKPHQNTVATILKILVDKEFVGINVFGRQHQYYPLISKEAYSKASIKTLVKSYFGGSFSEAVSFMVKENNISLEDLETLLQQLKKGKKMMAFAYYLLKVIVCSGILFLYYHLALRNKLFHQWNRFYLLAVVLLSLSIPLVQFTFIHPDEVPGRAIQLLQTVASADLYVEEVYIRGHQAMSTEQWLGLGYALVSAMMLLGLIQSVSKIYSLIRRHQVKWVQDIRFVATEEKGTPFSFFRYIFWNNKIDIHSTTGQRIFQHELVHVKEAHTVDKLFLQLTLMVFWCNPFFWLIRKELQMIHEFIADQKAVEQHDTAALAAMILQAAYPHRFNPITNPFFQSSIKRRLLMLRKIQNPRINYVSRILALPLIAFTALAFTFRTKKDTSIIPLDKPITVVIDAGHGKLPDGRLNGARAEQVFEDDIVLALAKKIREINANSKIHIELTRTSEAHVDLHKRVDIAREKSADLFISLHTGAAPEGKDGSGMEVLVSNKNTPFQKQSELLGSALKEELTAIYPTRQELIKRTVGVWVLDKNVCPSVLVECGYITDKKDREFITSNANQKRIAERILAAIERYAVSLNHLPPLNAQTDTVPQKKAPTGTSETLPAKAAGIRLRTQNDSRTQKAPASHAQPQPIYFVDGKEFTGDVNSIEPKNIASINVLKGQAAEVKYGGKGKNGVVEIITKKGERMKVTDTIPGTGPVFEKAETSASIDPSEWKKFLEKNLQPVLEEVSKKAPAGRYTIPARFIVHLDGSISDIVILEDPGYGMAGKIEALMQKSPKWKPAIQNGRLVRSYHTQPITLVIVKDKEPSKTLVPAGDLKS